MKYSHISPVLHNSQYSLPLEHLEHGVSCIRSFFPGHCVHVCKSKSLTSKHRLRFAVRHPCHFKAYQKRQWELPPQVLLFSEDDETHLEINSFIQTRAKKTPDWSTSFKRFFNSSWQWHPVELRRRSCLIWNRAF